MFRWAFVDDQPEPAATFAAELGDAESEFEISVVAPSDARNALLNADKPVDGILIDVDLSDVPGEHGSGPGLAQDIRINQENGKLAAFPLVRFSSRAKVLANIGGDASSDDLFDLKVDKEIAAREIPSVRKSLIGCSTVYRCVEACPTFAQPHLAEFLGLSEEVLESWTHPDFIARAESARSDRPHVAAGLIMRFLTQPGPLIDETILQIRLGVDGASKGWAALRGALDSIKYVGQGCDFFDLWWARGLEDWWLDCEGADTPLSSATLEQRATKLAEQYADLKPLTMPPESLGTRPWRVCELSREEEDPTVIPVDPAFGVRVVSRGNAAPWVDATYAALGVALQHREDPRVNKADLQRHAAQWQK